jgi:long-chain acyl-CoA synthetase
MPVDEKERIVQAPVSISKAGAQIAGLPVRSPWLKAYPKHIDWFCELEPLPLQSLLERSAAKFANKICCNFLGLTFTYSEIDRISSQLAKGLQENDVKKGKNVGLLLPNTPEYIICYYAILKAGGTIVNFNPLHAVDKLVEQAKDARLHLMVTHDLAAVFPKLEALLARDAVPAAVVCAFSDMLTFWKSHFFKLTKKDMTVDWRASTQRNKIIDCGTLIKNDGKFEPVEIDPENDVAVIQYTCGTTGMPKGAMLTHANLAVNVQQTLLCVPDFGIEDERVIAVLPFFHIFGMTAVMNASIVKGATLLVMPSFDPGEAIETIRRLKATAMPCLPTMFSALMNSSKLGPGDLSSLRHCISGGAALPLELKLRFEAQSGCKIIEGYGLTEASPTVIANPLPNDCKKGSVGIPAPGTRVSIRSLGDLSKEAALGENGELCVAGPQVMKGYWRRPKETADTMIGEFLRTGDVAFMDVEGYTYIVDRIKDIIMCSGFEVFPRFIEEAIYEYPGVEEVTVLGIPDRYRGEAPKAFIKLKSDARASQEDILKFLEAKLTKIQMPSEVEFRDSLPKTLIGKLSKKDLRAETKANGSKV